MAYGNELTPSVIDAIRGNGNGGGYGLGNGDGILWLLLFIILGGGRGWGGGYGYGNGAGGVGGNELYPWLNQSQNVNDGFRDQMMQTSLQSILAAAQALSTQLCNCCGDMQMAVANGFSNAEANANARQMANMQQGFGMQTAMMQGFNAAQAQTAQFAYDTGLGMAQQTATILAENCADRAALSDGVRDIIASNQAGTQAIIDKLCQLELDGVKNQLAQAERENVGLQNQLNMANLAASQTAQNAYIQQSFANGVDALYNRLNTCPVPSMPVYGRTPIFTCQSQQPTGCGCGMVA